MLTSWNNLHTDTICLSAETDAPLYVMLLMRRIDLPRSLVL